MKKVNWTGYIFIINNYPSSPIPWLLAQTSGRPLIRSVCLLSPQTLLNSIRTYCNKFVFEYRRIEGVTLCYTTNEVADVWFWWCDTWRDSGRRLIFFQIKHILIRDTWRDDVSGDQIMSQRIRGHRLTHHNLPFQANTLHSIDSKHIPGLVNQYLIHLRYQAGHDLKRELGHRPRPRPLHQSWTRYLARWWMYLAITKWVSAFIDIV